MTGQLTALNAMALPGMVRSFSGKGSFTAATAALDSYHLVEPIVFTQIIRPE